MLKFPLAVLLSLLVFPVSSLVAQTSTVIQSGNNGKLNYSYNKISDQQFTMQICFKHDQAIYKQEIDSVLIQSTTAFQEFKHDVQNSLLALQNSNSNFKIERAHYTLSSNDTGVAGFFIVLSNKSGTIQTLNNKFQVRVLLEWLNGIEFGKN